jgi:hypothetical protein
MKGVIAACTLCLSYHSHASLLLEESAKVCLSVPAYANLQIPSVINFESISKNSKGASKRFRASDELLLESNVPVQIVAIAPSISNGIETYTPNVFIDDKKDQTFIDYVAGVQSLDIRMDINLPENEIQKAGEYTGTLDVVVMADFAVEGCL